MIQNTFSLKTPSPNFFQENIDFPIKKKPVSYDRLEPLMNSKPLSDQRLESFMNSISEESNYSKISNLRIVTTPPPIETILPLITHSSAKVFSSGAPCFGLCKKKIDYYERLKQLVNPIMREINYSKINETYLNFSYPIDPTMAWASSFSVNVCPLFVIDLEDIPAKIRPDGWDDPRLCDLNYLQNLSDWIAEECKIPKKEVSFIDAAAAKTILKLKQDPNGMKALRAGIVHELGHVALGHCHSANKCSKQKEKEADIYAATLLPDGFEGIKIGFNAWQKSLQAVRSSNNFSWKDRILTYLLITPKGNLVPLFFTHGSFETRIKQVEEAQKINGNKKS